VNAIIDKLISLRKKSESDAKEIRDKLVWTVIDNKVYDITNYISMHPGGKRNILKGAFKDASEVFH
jgi:cytochrome b involved in lipid metabolism